MQMHEKEGIIVKKRVRSVLSAAAAIVFVAFILGSVVYYQYSIHAQEKNVETIKVAYLPITHSLPVLELAQETQDANSDIRIELVKYGSWPELMDALSSGNVDAASVLVELAIKAYDAGSPLQLAALGHRDGNVIVGSSSITKAGDLNGKTVAIPSPQSSHNILLHQYLETAALNDSNVTFLELAPTEMPFALQSGEIDAYCVAEPFGAQAVEKGIGHVLETSENLWKDSVCCGLVWNTDWSKAHPDTAQEFLDEYLKAGNALEEDPAQELSLAKEYLNGTEDVLKQSLQWISYNDLQITEDNYNTLAQKMIQYGLNDDPPTYQEFVYQGQKGDE